MADATMGNVELSQFQSVGNRCLNRPCLAIRPISISFQFLPASLSLARQRVWRLRASHFLVSRTKTIILVVVLLLMGNGCNSLTAPSPPRHGSITSAQPVSSTVKFLRDVVPTITRKVASNNRDWRPDLAILSTATFDQNHVTIHNVRNCRYRTEDDYDVRHYDLDFELPEVQSVDFIIVPFNDKPLLAHTMLSFGLADGQYFSISVEGRLEQGEDYSLRGGAGDEFELVYVIADERDVIPLRVDVRKVDVHLYPGKATPEQCQNLLVDMLQRSNKLSREPEFYDVLTNNCTTNLVRHVNQLRPGKIPPDWRVLLPGRSDELAYQLGLLNIPGSFEVAKVTSKINSLAALYRGDPDFSRRIRLK